MKTLTLQSTDLVRLMQGVWAQRAILVINLLLVIWIAWMLATLTWSLIAGPQTEEAVAIDTDPVPVKPDQNRQLIGQVASWHLFGESTQETPAPLVKPAVPIDAPETRLKLVLRGSFSSGDPDYARAIIADPQGKEEMYTIGDSLPGNAELREIHPEKVILMRSGRFETLHLPRDKEAARGRSGSRRSSAASGATRGSPSQRLKSIRQSLKQNPKSLYGLVRTTPQKDAEGNMVGYTLQPGSDPQLFESMGLQPGDIVTKINDISLDNLASGMQALKSAQSGEMVTMTVQRGDQEETLSFSIPE